MRVDIYIYAYTYFTITKVFLTLRSCMWSSVSEITQHSLDPTEPRYVPAEALQGHCKVGATLLEAAGNLA